MTEHAMESLLRPAVELYTVGICAGAGALCLHSPWAVALSPEVGAGMALAYTAFGLKRLNEARIVPPVTQHLLAHTQPGRVRDQRRRFNSVDSSALQQIIDKGAQPRLDTRILQPKAQTFFGFALAYQ